MTTRPLLDAAPARTSGDRRSLLRFGAVTTVLATLHLTDHVLRGERVVHEHLDPTWNHSGWPFQESVSPFTFSLVIVLSALLGGLLLTVRGRAWAGYWLATSVLLEAIVVVVHFLPTARQESPAVIYGSWPGQPVLGALAVAVTLATAASLAGMGVNAVRVRRRSGAWR